MEKAPIFVGGAGRSGTTLLRVILDTHPNIACGPEFKLIPSIAEHWAYAIKNFSSILSEYDLAPADVNAAYRAFVESLLRKFPQKAGKSRIAEKSPNNVFYFAHLNRLFPESPLVHVIRDGRDVVCSLLTMNWVDPASKKKLPYVETAQGAATYWVNAVTAGRGAAQADAVKANYFELKYEDMVTVPEACLPHLFEFLEEPWKPEVMEYHMQERNLAGESSAAQVSQKLYTGSVGRWKKDLQGQDKDTVKRIAGDTLVKLGYARDHSW